MTGANAVVSTRLKNEISLLKEVQREYNGILITFHCNFTSSLNDVYSS